MEAFQTGGAPGRFEPIAVARRRVREALAEQKSEARIKPIPAGARLLLFTTCSYVPSRYFIADSRFADRSGRGSPAYSFGSSK